MKTLWWLIIFFTSQLSFFPETHTDVQLKGLRCLGRLVSVEILCTPMHFTMFPQMTWQCSNCTWFDIQRARVDLDVQVLGGSGAELLEDALDGLCDIVRHRFGELHLAVDDYAAFPKVENLQFLEACQVGLQVRQQLKTETQIESKFVVCFCHVEILTLNVPKGFWELIWY